MDDLHSVCRSGRSCYQNYMQTPRLINLPKCVNKLIWEVWLCVCDEAGYELFAEKCVAGIIVSFY